MREALVTVVVPTLQAGPGLLDCVLSLERQSLREVELIIVDNSGRGLVGQSVAGRCAAKIIENEENAGFGAAINQGVAQSQAPYVATLNDDAVASPEWLEALVAAIEKRPDAGMCASRVSLADGRLDSAGMLVCADGSSRPRGHNEAPEAYGKPEDVLIPSGCAALYRRAMLQQVGGFDDEFFLYCDDSDLALRAQWAGWKCLYVPEAAVQHAYAPAGGRASLVRAYYSERNRLFVMLKNFPRSWVLRTPLRTLERHFWNVAAAFDGRGTAPKPYLPYLVARAHTSLLWHGPSLVRKRRAILRSARIAPHEFEVLLAAHTMSLRQAAAVAN